MKEENTKELLVIKIAKAKEMVAEANKMADKAIEMLEAAGKMAGEAADKKKAEAKEIAVKANKMADKAKEMADKADKMAAEVKRIKAEETKVAAGASDDSLRVGALASTHAHLPSGAAGEVPPYSDDLLASNGKPKISKP